ncbi:hypothetical protein ACWKSP_09015 [Micromonosporaceae bacterium Da 78-11]
MEPIGDPSLDAEQYEQELDGYEADAQPDHEDSDAEDDRAAEEPDAS